MSRAYRCKACGEYFDGHPAFEFDIYPPRRKIGGDLILGSETVSWPYTALEAELCPECAARAIPSLEWIFESADDH